MAKKSTRRIEPTGARCSLRHGPSRRLALLAWSICFLSFALPARAAELVSVNVGGIRSGNGASGGVALSRDGNFVAFYSDANDLVPNDLNYTRDVFVRDRNAKTTDLVSVNDAGEQGNAGSQPWGLAPQISDNGLLVAFYSLASNLVPGDTNNASDVFLRDRDQLTTILVSANPAGHPGNGASRYPSMSADGSLIAFESDASDLVPGDTNGVTRIFVWNKQTGTTEQLCGVQPNANSTAPAISADGRFVAFISPASNLVSTPSGGKKQVYVCDRNTQVISLISQNGGVAGNGDSMAPALSGDGNVVVFKSSADNLVTSDKNNAIDIFAVDRGAGTLERISVSTSGGDANAGSFLPAVTRDGHFVLFGSDASNLVYGDYNQLADMFIRDRQNHVTIIVDRTLTGGSANGGVPDSGAVPAITGDYPFATISFVTTASNLVWNDFSNQPDVIVLPNPFFCNGGGVICPTTLSSVSHLNCSVDFCVPDTVPTATVTPTVTTTPGVPTVTPTPSITPTPIACIGDEDCREGKVCFHNICVLPTATPTPIPCAFNSDCPSGLVCIDRICQPAISPTPTITPTPIPTCARSSDCAKTCSADGDCHAGQTCQSGQCSPADRCVDGICAPTRQCGPSDATACLATRETCLNDTCECGGDCNLDGFVFADEIAKMICILAGNCQVSECQAGDFDRDGQIKGNEVCQAVTNLTVGCPVGIANQIIAGGQTAEARTLSLSASNSTVHPGELVYIRVALGGSPDKNVATAQIDVLFDPRVLTLVGDPTAACAVDTSLVATDAVFSDLPRRPQTPDNETRLRTFIAQLAVCAQPAQEFKADSAFGGGPMLSCLFRVNPTAPLGPSMIGGERTNLGDVNGVEIPSDATPTDINVVQKTCTQDANCEPGLVCRNGICEPSCSSDSQCPEGDVCRTGACVPQCGTDSECSNGQVCRNSFCVPTCTTDSQCSNGLVCKNDACVPPCTTFADCPVGSSCVNGGCETTECNISTDCRPDLRQACVGSQCMCAGDCNNDGDITSQDVIIMNNILRGTAELSQCLAFDPAGVGEVGSQDILLVLKNLREGCP